MAYSQHWPDGLKDLGPPATGFKNWFAEYVDAIKAGKYVYSVDFGGLVDADFA